LTNSKLSFAITSVDKKLIQLNNKKYKTL